MKKIYTNIETGFEKLTLMTIAVLGNSITFILAFCLVLYWWIIGLFAGADIHQFIGDIIFGVTFLSLFILQKAFNRFSALLHLKINELVSSHEPADNTVMNASEKTEHEIKELSKEYIETEEMTDEISTEDNKEKKL